MTGPSTKTFLAVAGMRGLVSRAGAGSVPHHQHHVVVQTYFGLGGVAQQRL